MSAVNQQVAPSSPYLNIVGQHQQQEFLKSMLPDFLQVVDPWNSGLLDHMIERGLLTDTDRESLSAKDVRTSRDLRRKLWFLLNRLSPAELKTHVFPKLLKEFPHILPPEFLGRVDEGLAAIDDASDNICLRHAMMRRLRLDPVIDKMYQYDVLDLQQYEKYSLGGCTAEQLWTMFFGLSTSPNPRLPAMIHDLLETERIPEPADLGALLSRGIPCTCQQYGAELPHTPRSLADGKVDSWVRESPFELRSTSWGSAGSTKSSAIFSISSQQPLWESESVTTTCTSLAPPSVGAAFSPSDVCFGESGSCVVGRGEGRVSGMWGGGNDWPQSSGAAVTRPVARTSALTLKPRPTSGEVSVPAVISSASHVVEMAGHVDDPSLTAAAFRGQQSASGSQGAERGPSFMGKPMSVVLEIRKFVERHCWVIILLLAVWLFLDMVMNGFHIFRLFHIECEPSDHFMNVIQMICGRQDVLMNKTSNNTATFKT